MGHRLVAVLVFFGFVGSCCVQAASVVQKKAKDVGIEALLQTAQKDEAVRDLLADIYGEEDIEGNGENEWLVIKSWVVANKEKVWDKAFRFALYRKREAVPALVAAGMDPDGVVSDKDGRTFLVQAAMEGDKEVVNLLLDNGASIDKIDGKGRTALMYAAIRNNVQVVQFLLDNGADIAARDGDGDTVLMYAVRLCQGATLLLLIPDGANIHEKNNIGNTALMIATLHGNTDAVQKLLKRGANGNEKDFFCRVPLIEALSTNKRDVVQVLLDAWVDVNAQDYCKRTALSIAVSLDLVEVVNELIARGAGKSIDVLNENDGHTALMRAVIFARVEIVQALLSAGASINLFDSRNETALDLSVFYKNVEIQKLLREKGAKTFAELSSAGDQKDPSEVISSAPAAQPVAADPLAIPYSSAWSSLPSSRVIVLLGLAASLAAALYVWHYHPSNAASE